MAEASADISAKTPRPGIARESASKLHRRLTGDLDNIILKTLRKEPVRRYPSVEQLVEDIRRHLQGLPVTATPDSLFYRARKLVRRHQVGGAATLLLLVAIAGGVITTVREARIAEVNRQRAEARFNDVRKLANSLIFEVHDSIQDLPGATPARKIILQRALEYLDRLTSESGNEPDLLRELATAYERVGELQGDPLSPNLGDIKGASASLKKSIELREALVRLNPKNGKDQVELAAAYLDYSGFLGEAAGDLVSSYDFCNKAIAILSREAAANPKDLRTITQYMQARAALGFIEVGNGAVGSYGSLSDGVDNLKKALQLDQQAAQLAPPNRSVLGEVPVIYLVLGDAMSKLGNRIQALDYDKRSLDAFHALHDENENIRTALNIAVAKSRIADVLIQDGKLPEAINWYAQTQQEVAKLSAEDPNNQSLKNLVVTSSGQLGHALGENGRVDEGYRYLRHAVDIAESQQEQSPLIQAYEGIGHQWLGEMAELKHKLDEATREYLRSVEILRKLHAGIPTDVRIQVFYSSSLTRLGALYLKLGKTENAKQQYEISRMLMEPLSQANPENSEVLYALAESYSGEGRTMAKFAQATKRTDDKRASLASATDWFQKSLDTWHKISSPSHYSTAWMEVVVPDEVARELTESKAQSASL